MERRIKNARSNGIARIEALASMLLLPRIDGGPNAVDLRYQLLTACAGAIAEATRRKTSRAVMLVHEFVTSVTEDLNHRRNADDLDRFLSRMVGCPLIPFAAGKLHGPYTPHCVTGVQLYIGKVTRNLRFSTQ
jgi:hypothetical protein